MPLSRPLALLGTENAMSRSPLKMRLKEDIHEYYDNTCVYCEFPSEVIDHVIPVKAGGTNRRDNLVASCKRCNLIASDGVWESFQAKRSFILARRRREVLSRP